MQKHTLILFYVTTLIVGTTHAKVTTFEIEKTYAKQFEQDKCQGGDELMLFGSDFYKHVVNKKSEMSDSYTYDFYKMKHTSYKSIPIDSISFTSGRSGFGVVELMFNLRTKKSKRAFKKNRT